MSIRFPRQISRRRLIQAGVVTAAGAKFATSAIFGTKPAFGGAMAKPPAGYLTGMCYGGGAFPSPYTPSNANTLCVTFGSDNEYAATKPLWGPTYTPDGGTQVTGRNDLQVMQGMGVNLVRLYDWEPRNDHLGFLDAANALGIKVLMSVSDYFLKDGNNNANGGYDARAQDIPALIKSLANSGGNDYHPAIWGILIGNEPRIGNKYPDDHVVTFTKDWVAAEGTAGFTSKPMIGAAVDFGTYGLTNPAWVYFNEFVPTLQPLLGSRMILAPNTTNPAGDLFTNFAGQGKGWVQLTYEKYSVPILFTEISVNRLQADYQNTITGQLTGAVTYANKNPGQLLGTCFFEFADKVWVPGTTEGSFGAYSHGSTVSTVTYSPKDFTHWDVNTGCTNPLSTLNVDTLTANPAAGIVKSVYMGTALASAAPSTTATSTSTPPPPLPPPTQTSTPPPTVPPPPTQTSTPPPPVTPTSTPPPIIPPTNTPFPAPTLGPDPNLSPLGPISTPATSPPPGFSPLGPTGP
jgi:hypothetical protein